MGSGVGESRKQAQDEDGTAVIALGPLVRKVWL